MKNSKSTVVSLDVVVYSILMVCSPKKVRAVLVPRASIDRGTVPVGLLSASSKAQTLPETLAGPNHEGWIYRCD